MCKSSWRKWCTTDSGLLALRIGIGAIFVYTGWLKVSDLSVTVTQFSGMGFAPFWAYIVSFVEIIGGVAVLLGHHYARCGVCVAREFADGAHPYFTFLFFARARAFWWRQVFRFTQRMLWVRMHTSV